MRIISWNCAGGLRAKMDEIRLVAAKHAPDCLLINEAELKNDDNLDYFGLQGYSLYKKPGLSRCVGYIKDGKNIRIHSDKFSDEIVNFSTNDYHIIGAYRGFHSSLERDEKLRFEKILSTFQPHLSTILVGDLNTDPTRDSGKWNGKMLKQWMIEKSVVQLVKGNTRKRTVNKIDGTVERG